MLRKSPSQIEAFLNRNWHKFTKPSSLYGQEPNSVTKSRDKYYDQDFEEKQLNEANQAKKLG